ncbi:Malectin-A [Nymphon striatum]|nr:Malectin-A [Nymphon striatum]
MANEPHNNNSKKKGDLQCSLEAIYAVNSGGGEHRDIHDVQYIADPVADGIASDFGKTLMIDRAHEHDQILYQTERYSLGSFQYDIPRKLQDGHYVFVLKFCEVYFRESNRKVFDVMLNEHKVISELDIFDNVGHGVAHEEYIEFTVEKGSIMVNGQKSEGPQGRVVLQFVKAFYIAATKYCHSKLPLKNTLLRSMLFYHPYARDNVPKLPPPSKLYEDDDEEDIIKQQPEKKEKKIVPRRPSGPKTPNPYESDDNTSKMLPIFIAISAFVPIAFCL